MTLDKKFNVGDMFLVHTSSGVSILQYIEPPSTIKYIWSSNKVMKGFVSYEWRAKDFKKKIGKKEFYWFRLLYEEGE